MRAKPDAGLRPLFRTHIKGVQWTSIESGLASPGVPDSEFCFAGGCQGWLEFKRADAWAVVFRPLQVAWIARRARLGGRVFVAVRRDIQGTDELWLLPGRCVSALALGGLRAVRSEATVWSGKWDWAAIAEKLKE